MKNLLKVLGIIALSAIISFGMMGCDSSSGGGGGTDPVAVSFTGLTADGSASQTTSKLTLTFDKAVAGLSAADITLSGITGAAKGTLTAAGAAGVYELFVSDITTAGQVTVTLNKSGFTFTPNNRNVNVNYFFDPDAIPVSFTGLAADGSATTFTTNKLTLTFDKTITNLSADDITLTSGSTGAVKGTLNSTATAGVYELTVNGITASGTVTVFVSKSGYTIADNTKQVQVYYCNIPGNAKLEISYLTDVQLENSLIVNGVLTLSRSGSPSTVKLVLQNPDRYDSVSWFVQNTSIWSNENDFTLDAKNPNFVIGKIYFVTAEAFIGTTPLSKTISFTVTN